MASEFQQYQRKQIAELRPYVAGEPLDYISISNADIAAGSPKTGDMIARNPKNHEDQWLVAAQYFADNFEPLTAALSQGQDGAVGAKALPRNNSRADGWIIDPILVKEVAHKVAKDGWEIDLGATELVMLEAEERILTSPSPAQEAGAEPVAQLGGTLDDLRNVLKAVLYHFGPDGAAKVTRDALEARDPSAAPYMVPEEAVRGEDWENAAHELFWKTGKEDLFELLRAQAHDEAEERRAAKTSVASSPNRGGGDG